MEINVEKTKVTSTSRQSSPLQTRIDEKQLELGTNKTIWVA